MKLPSSMKVHDVFHVSLLEKVSPDNFNRQPIALPPVVIDSQEEYEVEKILNSKLVRNKIKYLVRWKGYGPEENSWEPLDHLTHAEEEIAEFHGKNPLAAKPVTVKVTRSGRKANAARR